jgi:hypothetical protein
MDRNADGKKKNKRKIIYFPNTMRKLYFGLPGTGTKNGKKYRVTGLILNYVSTKFLFVSMKTLTVLTIKNVP